MRVSGCLSRANCSGVRPSAVRTSFRCVSSSRVYLSAAGLRVRVIYIYKRNVIIMYNVIIWTCLTLTRNAREPGGGGVFVDEDQRTIN